MNEDIKELVKEMTTEEKTGLIHGAGLFRNSGVPRLNIPPVIMSDGPLGVRFDFKDNEWLRINEEKCTVSWMISGTALASTWNEELAEKVGDTLGMEARGRGKDIILAPGINIHRTPLCGRNFEYMSEDPYLCGKLVARQIKGIQKNDVAACVKHFALNNQETNRMEVNVEVDERTLFELYLPAFQAATTHGGSYSIMCSYNRFRSDYVSDNSYLLTDILRKKWGFDGVVISDWGAVHSTKKSYEAGVDLEMSVTYDFDNYFFANPLINAINNNEIDTDILDEKCERILTLLERIKKIGKNTAKRSRGAYNLNSSHNTLLCAAREAVVLLKNDDKTLPIDISKVRSIAVIGDAATRKLSLGGGSSEIDALFEITPLIGISMLAGGLTEVRYAPGYYVDNEENTSGDVNWQAESLDSTSAAYDNRSSENAIKQHELLNEAVQLAKECDIVIYVGGLNRSHDTEGFDRTSYELPYNQDVLINELLKVKPDMIISINSGSAINLSSFADSAKAILWNSMNGMMGGLALAEVIFGKTNPSGKLPVSFPSQYSDSPAVNMDGNYSEGIYVGYRYYESKGVKPLYSFGHGLSYTEFSYSDITACAIENESAENTCILYNISCIIKNTGKVSGKETVQLYISPECPAIDRPRLELKGFKKIHLEPEQEEKVTFELTPASFAYYDTESGCYRADKGNYTINIGSACDDIKCKINVHLNKDYIGITSLID